MNTEISVLKAQIKEAEQEILTWRQVLKESEAKLAAFQKQADETVVDGLRMKVREFIAQAKAPVLLKRHKAEAPKFPPGVCGSFIIRNNPYLENSFSKNFSIIEDITEEEAGVLSSKEGRQSYNIDYSVWDTYRYPGEID